MNYYYAYAIGPLQLTTKSTTDPDSPIQALALGGSNETFDSWTAYRQHINDIRFPVSIGFGIEMLDYYVPGSTGMWILAGDNKMFIPFSATDIYWLQVLHIFREMDTRCYALTPGVSTVAVTQPTVISTVAAPPATKHYATVRNGLRVGESSFRSTGRVKFAEVTGWQNSSRAKSTDDIPATHDVVEGYTTKLVAKKPNFTLPANSVIKGIKVYVRRRRI